MPGTGQFAVRRPLSRTAVTAFALTAALVLSLLGLAPAAQAADTVDPPTLSAPSDGSTVTRNPTFTWNAVAGAVKYRIQVSTSPLFSGTPTYTADVFGTSATPTAELPLGTLYWHVASIDSAATVGAYSTAATLIRNQPAAPTLTGPADGHDFVYPTESPVLSWSAVPGMATYTVQVDDDTDFSVDASSFSTENTSFTLPTSIPSANVRYWRVQGVSTTSGVTTAWSNDDDLRSFTVTWPESAAPTLVSPADDAVTPVDDVAFSWVPVPGAAKYELQTSTNPLFTAGVATYTTYAAEFRPLDTPQPDQYFWRVRAVDPSGNVTDYSDHWTFNRVWLDELDREARPTVNVTDTDGSTLGNQVEIDKLSVSWTPIPRATRYELEISTDPTFLSASTSTSMVRRTCLTPHTTWTPYLAGDYTETSGFSNCAWAGTPTSIASSRFLVVGGGPYYVRVRAIDETPSGDTIVSSWSNAATDDRTAPPASVFSVVASTSPTTAAGEPAEPLPTPASTDTPRLTWKPVDGAVAYLVWMSRDESFNNPVLTGGGGNYVVTSQTELVLADVLLDNDSSESYYWFALPCSRWDSVGHANNVCTVGPQQAIQIDGYYDDFRKLGLAASGATGSGTHTDTVRLSWDDQLATSPSGGGVKWYEVEVRNSSNAVVDTVVTDATGYTPIAEAYPDGPYTWRVRAVDSASAPLAWSAATPFTKSSSAPTSPAVNTSPVRGPTLTWDATSFAKSYQVEIYRGSDAAFPLGSRESVTTTVYPAATPSDALAAGVYSWRVRQLDFAGNTGAWSTGNPGFTVGAGVPTATSPVGGASAPTGSLVFAWSGVTDAVRYRFQSATSDGFNPFFEDVTTVSPAYASTKAYVGGTTYFWRVQVLNNDGDVVATSNPVSFVATTVPGTPSASLTTNGTTVTVAYTAGTTGGTPITGYSVRYRVFGTTTWTYLDRAADTASVALSGMATSTKYEAQVAARNSNGTGAYSASGTVTTPTTPSAPGSLKATAGVGTLAVSWSAPSSGGSAITGYHLRWTDGSSPQEEIVTGTSKTLSLSPGVAYYVDVAAINAVGTGPFATTILGTPKVATPTPTSTPKPTATTTSTPTPTTPSTGSSGATALKLSGSRTISSGATATLTGSLKTTAGGALGSMSVAVQSRPVGSTSWAKVASATTNSTGAFTANVKPAVNREYRVLFAAAKSLTASTSGTVKILVAPKVTRTLNKTTVKRGAKVVFTGKVSPVHKAKKVNLQRLQKGKWVTKKSGVTTSKSTYRFSWKTDSKKDFAWRVTITAHSDHTTGVSPKIVLKVN